MAGETIEPRGHPGLETILDAIANWISRYREAVGERWEFAKISADDVARIAHDAGIDTVDLFELVDKAPGAADLLQKMLGVFGVDHGNVVLSDPLVMRDLQTLCIHCSQKKRCKHDIAAGTAAEHYREYCPNTVTLDALFKRN